MTAGILIVDDDPRVIAGIKRLLRQETFQCFGASSAGEALDFLQRQRVDLVISDEKMPGMSGHQLLALVARRYPDTMRMMLTGHADLDIAVKAINEGRIYRFLLKPVSATELITAIRQALEHRQLLRQVLQLKRASQKKSEMIRDLERRYPGISNLTVDADGRIILDMD